MTQDQLHKARRIRWRQDGNALLTLDDAERWLAETPLCLFLPRRQHLPIPAPSFVEAVAGRPDPTPAPAEIATASQMLARLVASGAVVALDLVGSPSGIVGEQPDFLATPEALPYLYALQPERNPKRPPTTRGSSRVSPLAAEAFDILTREGALTAAELRERLGREVTEAATLRALGELWHAMRVVPVPGEDAAPAHWELLSARHGRELNIGSTQSQTTALSILVSFYLQSAIAATPAEAELILSPLASRSRIRDVIHGLTATRQLASFSLHGEEQLYVEGTLPEIPEEEAEPVPALETNLVPQQQPELDAGLEQNEPSIIEATASAPVRFARKPRPPRREQDKDQRRTARPGFADRARRPFKPREREDRRPGGFRRPERDTFRKERPEQGRFDRPERRPDRIPERTSERIPERSFDKPAASGKSFRRGDKYPDRGSSLSRPPKRTFGQRGPRRNEAAGGESERRPFRSDQERRPFNREERRPFGGEDRRPFRRDDERGGGRPPRREDRPPSGDRERRPYAPSGPRRGPAPAGGERRPFRRDDERGEGRPPRRENRPPSGDRERRPYAPSGPRRGPAPAGGERRPFRRDDEGREGRPPRRENRPPSGDRERRPYAPSGPRRGPAPAGGERRPFRKEDREQRPFNRRPLQRDGERAEGRPSRRENRPPSGDRERRPYAPSGPRPPSNQRRSSAPTSGERRPFRKPADRFQSGDRPRAGFKPRRNGEAGAPPDIRKPSGKSFGRPGSRPPSRGPFKPKNQGSDRRARPGGFTPPRRTPRKDSGEGDEG